MDEEQNTTFLIMLQTIKLNKQNISENVKFDKQYSENMFPTSYKDKGCHSSSAVSSIGHLVFLIFNPRLEVRCSHESTEGFSQRSRRGGPSGLASPQEGGPEPPGQQVEKILVCPEEQFSVLVHRQDGESRGDQQRFAPVGSLGHF